jgi:hypothetical protein
VDLPHLFEEERRGRVGMMNAFLTAAMKSIALKE